MKELRDQFPIFRHHPNLIYLDSAATSHKPDCVIEELVSFYAKDYGTVHRSVYKSSLRATELYAAARETVRRFLNAKESEEIVFTRGTTDAINLIANSLALESGDEIFVSEAEHHSNLVPWQMAAKRSCATLRILPLDAHGSTILPARFPARTKLIALAHISNVTGAIADCSKIVRPPGALLLIDGAQAAPHLPIDVQALGADFYAFSGHKCYGPTGIGVLYGKRHLLDALFPVQGGGGMVQRVELLESSYEAAPLRFEAGTPITGSAIGLGAALRFLESARSLNPAAWEQHLLALATEGLKQIPGLRILGETAAKGPILTFAIEGVHPLDLASLLDCKEIAIRTGHLCAQPLLRHFGLTAASRASFALYNTQEEVFSFRDAVENAVKVLR